MVSHDHSTSDREAALAALLVTRRRDRVTSGAAPLRAGGDFPGTAAQRRIWLADQLGAVPHATFGLRISGPLRPDTLAGAFAAVVARHDAMRSVYATVDGQLRQRVLDRAEVRLDRVDLTGAPAGRVHETATRAAAERFDLTTGPLFRATLMTVGPDEHILLFVGHHIAFDEQSVDIVLRDLATAYAGTPLPGPPVRYADPEPATAADRLAYWREQLPPADGTLPCTVDGPRDGTSTAVRVRLAPGTLDRLRAVGGHPTPFVGLVAVLMRALARYTGNSDVRVGTVSSGRARVGLDGVVGCFVNPVVLRTDLAGAETFAEVVRRVRHAVSGALAHEVPFDELVAAVNPVRRPGTNPLFQVALHLHRERGYDDWPGLRVAVWHHDPNASDVDLTVEAMPHPDGSADLTLRTPRGALEDGAAATFGRYLQALAEHPDDPRLPDDTAAWNDTARPVPGATVLDLIVAQAARTPDAVAVVDAAGTTVSYAELLTRVDARAKELGPTLVAVRMSRSIALVEAVLAVWRAGGAYVPVDPDYPAARQELVLADSGAALVLTDDGVQERPTGRSTVDAAYVLYTSGSTGRPKGVAVGHRALTNFVLDMRDRLDAGPDDRWLAVTSLAFDIAGLELFLPLVTGGRIVLADEPLQRDGKGLAELVARAGVTHVQTTPSRWRLLLAAGVRDVTALVGGEALPLPLARELRAVVPRLVNVYGPTETTIWSTAWEVPADPGEVLIGRPIANTRVYLCDERGRAVPIGAVGELCIGGAGVAQGYLDRPGLTADRFRPDPWGAPGSRLYRTGDRARWGADGHLRFLGRVDNQIKLHGHRIELGEIEARLAALPGVRHAAVAVHEEQLTAYVVGAEPDRGALAELLPDYMVPRHYEVLDALPLTPNGKLDRAALPAPTREAAGVAPRTATERLVAGIWAEVLGRAGIGVGDDFFVLGGHSLPAMTVAARLSVACGYEVAVRLVFAEPTVAGLAAAVDALASAPGSVRDVAVVPRPDPTAPAPLSPGQQRLWFLQQLDPGDAAYNMTLVYRLRGPLDPERLQAALDTVVARHDVLRTRFVERDEEPVQLVTARRPVLECADDPAAVPRWCNAPFDLTAGMLLRAGLVRNGTDEHVLCLVMHHIAGDGRSLGILVEELYQAYEGVPLPALPVRYADFAVWQRARPDAGAALAYWTAQLAGVPALELATDRPRPATQTSRGAFVRQRLAAGTADALERLAGQYHCTLFMVLLAGYQAVLARHTGQDEVSVGTSISDRARPELAGLIGLFINTLVLRTDVSGDPTFAELLGRVRDTALAAYAHPDIPFEALTAALNLPRDASRTALFQTMLILHTEAGAGTRVLPGVAAELTGDGFAQAKFDLMLDAWREPDGLQLSLNYRTDLFDAATAARLLRRVGLLLDAVTADPDRPLSSVDLLAPGERPALLALGHGPTAGAVRDVADLVAEWAVRTPGAPAVSCGPDRLTYAELDSRATTMARQLGGDRVVVSLPRGLDLIVTLLAALKAGVAYVPIDPRYPTIRRDLIRADSGPLAGGIAYVIYTSGSTGTPKGVAVSRAALATRVAWMRERYTLSTADKVVQFATVSFDTHVEEVWPTLTAGAHLVLLPPDEDLPDLLAREDVTVLDLPTPYWHELVGGLDQVRWPASLRLLILGADQVRADAVATWRGHIGDRVEVLNTYGPTEATVIATTAALDGSDGRPPIGTPIADTRVYIVDRNLRLVPSGVPGELCIAGAGLAEGYVNRPALTAERFRPDPFGPPGTRMYRTGDRVRWRVDGRLEFLGRLDDQVKIRGYRVEPGEVEAALGALPGVRQAAVIARDDTLLGYAAGTDLDAESLRRGLAERLPAYLVPTHLVVLEQIPLTVNGKVDRAALPAPASAGGGYVAPRTATEDLVAQVWAGALGVDRVGAFDDFFALGGHSLLAIGVVARLCAATGRDIGVRALFLQPTVAGLAAAVDQARGGAGDEPVVRGASTSAPLSFGQQRLWFLHQLDPADASYNIAVAYRLRGPLDVDRLETALWTVVARHEALRTRFVAGDDEPVQEIVAAAPVLLRGTEDDVRRWTNTPFDLTAGLLLRAGLVDLGAGTHVLCLVVHHIAGDGRSLGILVRELRAAYAGEPLPALPVRYADFAAWQRARPADDQLGYWRRQLAAVPVLDLPTDRPRPELSGFAGDFLVHDIPDTGVRRLAAEARCTPFMVLLTAYEALLARVTGQADFCVGTPIENRPRVEVADLVGFFVNTLALRATVDGDPTFRELLARTRDTALAAYAHQDVPFDRLLAAVDVPRLLNRTPLFQTMFTLHTEDAAGTDVLPGVTAEFYDPGVRQVKMELSLDIWRTDGLRVVFGYRSDLFDRATIADLAQQYADLLQAMVADPDAPAVGAVTARQAPVAQAPPPFVPPRTAAEELVAGVWTEVLGLDRVGVHDDFFAVGGHSLLAMKVVARLRAATGTEVPLRTVFSHPTLGALADAVEDLVVADIAELSDDEAEAMLR